MKARLIEHLLSVLFVSVVLIALIAVLGANRQAIVDGRAAEFERYGDLSFVNTNDPFHRALLTDAVNAFYPGQAARNAETVTTLLQQRQKQFDEQLRGAHVTERLTFKRFGALSTMYLKFVIVYLVVMVLTYYGVQTIAVWRFCRRRHAADPPRGFGGKISAALRASLLTVASFVLFCPAYVIAYSMRTELNTDTVFFMALLGVVSNGLLMVYANKFYAFLVAESRKGYVEQAVVKGLHNSYSRSAPDGITYRAILRPFKRFSGHAFGHIFANARFQYFSTLKEQASFLITGLIIIEMALNIHGHLSYEMLRQMLYHNYDIVVAIILGIFYTVKSTEIATDVLVWAESRRYENRV